MSSMAEYLKKYQSKPSAEEKKKKKKTKEGVAKHTGWTVIEEDAFASVDAAKQKEYESDEEREEIEIVKESVKKAKVVPGFKKTFAQVEETVVKQEVKSEDEISPPRRPRQRHDSDESPPRRQQESPPRRQRHDSDNSPPRQSRKRHDSDCSPPRRQKSSPPRRQRHDSDNSPPRSKRRRHDSDASPPRRQQRDQSPPRRRRHDSDNSPVRRGQKGVSSPRRRDDDNSPPRKNARRSSPVHRSRKVASPQRIKQEIDSDEEVPNSRQKTLEGKVAGLQTAKALREEGDRIRAKNDKLFEEMDAEISGRDAETVHRKKQTKKGNKETDEEKAKKEREAKKTAELQEKYKSWNKGVAQIRDRQEKLEEAARVAAEPLARRQDDEEMNRHLKEKIHEEDPMAAALMKKKRLSAIDRGELVYPTYQGAWAPNRFGIAPGYRWDGVDRSNGFEGKLARSHNQQRANQAEYYKAIAEYE